MRLSGDRTTLLLVGMVVAALVIVGAVVLVGGVVDVGGDSRAEIMTAELQSEYDEIEGLEATVEIERNQSHIDGPATAAIWKDGDDRVRQDVIDGNGTPEGVTILSDDETISYSVETDMYATFEYRLDILDIHSYDHDRIIESLDDFDAEYHGTDEIDGRTAHHLVYTVPDGEEGSIPEFEFYTYNIGGTIDVDVVTPQRVELWIDNQETYPLRHEVELDDETDVVVEYTNVSFGPIDESVFEFDPPDDAEEFEEAQGALRQFDSIEAATAYAGFTVDIPETVNDHQLEVVEVKEMIEGRSVVGWYETEPVDHDEIDRNESINVEVTEDGFREEFDGEEWTVDDHDVVVDDVIALECDGRYYTIDGNVSEQQLLDIARAIEC